jgi:hypothetical protein
MSISSGTAQNTPSAVNIKNPSVEIIRYTISADQHANFEDAYKQAGKLLQESAFCLGYRSGMLGHARADFGAVAAGGGADAAVLHVWVVFAFLGATVTDAFAKLAKLPGEIAV